MFESKWYPPYEKWPYVSIYARYIPYYMLEHTYYMLKPYEKVKTDIKKLLKKQFEIFY